MVHDKELISFIQSAENNKGSLIIVAKMTGFYLIDSYQIFRKHLY